MRLINAESKRLEPPTARPRRYAILSHTWGDDEPSFQTYQGLQDALPDALQDALQNDHYPKGLIKVFAASVMAKRDGYDYLWVDTCCIDKTNSTELSEAINSMFRWYAEAEVCYAYLSDVPGDDHVTHRNSSFRASRWFTRGWTLQELLAPKEVRFYASDWKFLGSKTSLKDLVSSITGIPADVLVNGECRPPARTIGEVFSWISRRHTTLEEDMAYSLLGLLNINLPLIYGEGTTAFMRVQEELLRRYDDESIFAWEAPPSQAITKPLSVQDLDEVGQCPYHDNKHGNIRRTPADSG
ncbi:HET-domain-containing protein [Coniochaeta ligniaria NRRL 30616]|uniref:HET-domain-containing protein n=1 Tax=Coniochaeta ligniaria NRRL 30616 TaxID=1408157 RepID=A0A1J7JW30_9PEZI|nr:HET-domain-containing protein [Coniochaeta ligniaria NRRL 30616]